MSNEPEPLRIITDEQKNIFDTDVEYIIPLYQRAYAWEERQLTQLVEDIWDIHDSIDYYIGTLIVYKHDNKFEVVDGQQRLTSLYLLLNCLGLEVKNTLSFACREKSHYTLENIKTYINNPNQLDESLIERSITQGINILKKAIRDKDKEQLISKIQRIIIYRIELPENTNLNRYFEIMNTRGEQLEQQDILKTKLMRILTPDEIAVFSKIWDACSDMSGFVQTHFDLKSRTIIFGSDLQDIPSDNWNVYMKLSDSPQKTELDTTKEATIDRIIEPGFETEDYEEPDENGKRVKYESIITFPFFLLHALRIFIAIKKFRSKDPNKSLTDEQMDDKLLCDSFEKVLDNGVDENGNPLKNQSNNFSKGFIICLLRTRFLFDKYMIKRKFEPGNTIGEWVIEHLEVSNRKKATYYPVATHFSKKRAHEPTVLANNKTNVMLQSALRTSYTSPKSMHWITKLLNKLSSDSFDAPSFYSFTEDVLKNAVIDDFFKKCIADFDQSQYKLSADATSDSFFANCIDGPYASFSLGLDTPNIVFNYLDYLIWKDNTRAYKDFVFEFRTSVEHWYPQNPSSDNLDKWEGGGVDQLGNLCLVSSSVNSRFSNNPPSAKASSFKNTIKKNSIKLQKMRDVTQTINDDYKWRESEYIKHELEMLKILMRACNERLMPIYYKDKKYDSMC